MHAHTLKGRMSMSKNFTCYPNRSADWKRLELTLYSELEAATSRPSSLRGHIMLRHMSKAVQYNKWIER